jgi:hypothetical protein
MSRSKVNPELSLAAPAVSVAVTDSVAAPGSVAAADLAAAANDDSLPKVANDLRNPLWIIAIGMAWFFGITAAVIALS